MMPVLASIRTTLTDAIAQHGGFAGVGWGLGASYQSVDQVMPVIEALVVLAILGLSVTGWRRSRASARL